MKSTKLIVAGVIAVSLTIIPAILHGRLLNRWGLNEEIVQASKSLLELPASFGPWTKIEEREPLSERVQRELGLTEHFGGRYVHSETGQSVQLLIMAGQPGPLVRHPPDICYASTGNTPMGEPTLWSTRVDGAEHQFKVLAYSSTAVLTGEFTVTYGFFDGTVWKNPKLPRIDYGGKPWLWKMQVLCNQPLEDEEVVQAASQSFLKEIIATSVTPNAKE